MTLATRIARAVDLLNETSLWVAVAFLPFSKSAAEIGIGLSLGFWILGKIFWREKILRLSWADAALLVFLAFTLLSVFHTADALKPTAVRGFWKWAELVALYFMSKELFQDPKKLDRLVRVFVLSLTAVALNGLYQLHTGTDMIKHYSIDTPGRLIRMKSSFGSPNDLASFFLIGIPLAFHLWLREKKWSPKSVGPVLILSLFGVAFISTFSRSAFLALGVAIAIFSLLQRKIKCFLGLIVFVPCLLLSSAMLRQNYLDSLSLSDITIGERLRFWTATWKMILAHPLLGHGVNTYFQKLPLYLPAIETYRGYAHNCYLQMWSEIGFFGLATFLVHLTGVFWSNPAICKYPSRGADLERTAALGIGLLAFLIQSFFDTNFYAKQTSFLFWIFWGAFAALRRPYKAADFS